MHHAQQVIVCTTDNGGELPYYDGSGGGGAGNNYPLRGGKFGLFEGGIRAHAFVRGPTHLLPASLHGTRWGGLAHASDVYVTVAHLAGIDVGKMSTGPYPVDGFNLWPAIAGQGASPRKEIVHQPLNKHWDGTCSKGEVTCNNYDWSIGLKHATVLQR